ncbi:YqhG family protein [Paenibacillus pinistramenti]|uniref:YqhG family protein n=1 Tax=Paenibacillus pinistramenti TaxID=1768003 RepID=UPI001108967A|nr:YqhG family protein [Paenibacillus pinistramenti]
MTMSAQQISQFVRSYLKATDCDIREQSDHHVTVKLSPQADRELTNRPYYWAYVDRCGVEPETMSFTFVFDQEQYDSAHPAASPEVDSVMSRHFGAIRPLPILGPGRVQREELTFGSPRLQQLFEAARRGGSYVYVFEDPGHKQRTTLLPAAYERWLGVCFKAEFACDMKREELYFYGISLMNGALDTLFGERICKVNLIHRIPENISIIPTVLSVEEGKHRLEEELLGSLRQLDDSWAAEARQRLEEELAILDGYYSQLLVDENEEARDGARQQYEARKQEIRWQFDPRIQVSAINCGIYHLRSGTLPRT